MKRFLVFLLLIILCLSFTTSKQKKWGFAPHKRINRMAVFTLPKGMFGFYKIHIQYISDHAVDADKRRYATDQEAPRHYINVDQYITLNETDPFKIIPQRWLDAEHKYGKDTLEMYGILPWHIQVMLLRLSAAMQEKKVDLILKYSADIGHYIADAHVPLHTTKNYNGQLTDQRGIHGFWETRIPELNAEKFNYLVGKAKYIRKPLKMTWKIIEASYDAVDSVLTFEKKLSNSFPSDKKYSLVKKGKKTIKTPSEEYSNEYNTMLDDMVEKRMRSAIHSVGSFWYTAWVNAGQPNLDELIEETVTDSLHVFPVNIDDKKIKGRDH